MTIKPYNSKGIVLVLACAAQFMVVLDIAIVNEVSSATLRDHLVQVLD